MCFLRYMISVVCVGIGSLYAGDIAGIYLTHKGTEGGQAIVEIFEHNGEYFVYGLHNLEAEPIADKCNKNPELRTRKSVGVVFGYGYKENEKGQFVGGQIYNFYNCKTYHGKIVPKGGNKLDFVGALDSYYILSQTYEWRKLSPQESAQYEKHRLPKHALTQTIADTIRSKR